MGDPKRQRKKYSTPGHPWQRGRIEEESALVEEYGFKNKTEIWKMRSFLRDSTAQAKKLVTLTGPQAELEKGLLLTRLKRYGLLPQDAVLDAVLSISLRDVLERRLQTLVYKKNLANTMRQARQFITHKHIRVGEKVVTSPSYLVPLSEEGQLSFRLSSQLNDPEHPERLAAKKAKEKEAKERVVVEKEPKEEGKGGKRAERKGFRQEKHRKLPKKREQKAKESGK
jgi:small subunit ribosomal protein S4